MNILLYEVDNELTRQVEKWGEQNHPDGTVSDEDSKILAEIAKKTCDEAADAGELTWRMILMEEIFEAFAETDPAALKRELIQVAAVAVSWAEAIERREVS